MDISKDVARFVRYISFKADCMREQEANPLTIDRVKAQGHYDELAALKVEKTDALREAMPKKAILKYKEKPKVMTKKDGSLSALAIKWYEFLQEQGLPRGTEGPVGYISGYEDSNPSSPAQVKEWLFSLGWKPCHYKYVRDKETGDERKTEQVRYSTAGHPRKGELTDSVLALKEKDPAVEILEGLTVATHRMAIFKSFLEKSDQSGKVHASAQGLTNTLRFKHASPFVNLPKADGEVPWGVEIRGCIIAPEGQVMCGSDVVSLESTTKRHYMFPHDPDYVNEMSVEGFDEHLDLAKHAGKVTQEEIEQYNLGNLPSIKPIRGKFKGVNYAGVYGVGKVTLSRSSGMSQGECATLIKAYWDRNWAVKAVAKEQYVKTLKDGSMWLKNPISGFYYSLRYEKDIFSTLNQGTGVYIFDNWLLRVRKKGVIVPYQYHDELMTFTTEGGKGDTQMKLEEAMMEVNKSLKLNVDVGVDVQFGNDYAEVH